MSLILNILWVIFGGFLSAAAWLLAALLMVVSVVGIPWVPAAIRMANYSFAPFGRDVVAAPSADGLTVLGNIVWFVAAGWWLALGHLVLAFACAVTIVGIPFAWAHLKLARFSLTPVATCIVPNT